MDGGITYLTRQTLSQFKGCPCPVCLEKFVPEREHIRRPRVLSGCRHVFCAGCLIKLIQPVCPVCRSDFTPPEIDSIPNSQNSQESQDSQSQLQSEWQTQSDSQQPSAESDSDPSSQESAISSLAMFSMDRGADANVPQAILNFGRDLDRMVIHPIQEDFPSSQASAGWVTDDESQPVPESQPAFGGSQ